MRAGWRVCTVNGAAGVQAVTVVRITGQRFETVGTVCIHAGSRRSTACRCGIDGGVVPRRHGHDSSGACGAVIQGTSGGGRGFINERGGIRLVDRYSAGSIQVSDVVRYTGAVFGPAGAVFGLTGMAFGHLGAVFGPAGAVFGLAGVAFGPTIAVFGLAVVVFGLTSVAFGPAGAAIVCTTPGRM